MALPSTTAQWKQVASSLQIPLERPLIEAPALPSGSKFNLEHFLHLHIIYSGETKLKVLGKENWFPQEELRTTRKSLEADQQIKKLRGYLNKDTKISNAWTMARVKEQSYFAVALEHLHLISSKKPEISLDQSHNDSPKISWSPTKISNLSTSVAALNLSSPLTPPPTSSSLPMPILRRRLFDLRPSYDSDDSVENPRSASAVSGASTISPPNTDLRRAQDVYALENFTYGDEQTVNACLVALIMALSWTLGVNRRVRLDRELFTVPRDHDTTLYAAAVDGLIMTMTRDNPQAFMETKRDLRTKNTDVRRQIAAQMASFIYTQETTEGGRARKWKNECVTT